MNSDSSDSSQSFFSDLVNLLHAVVVLFRVADRDNVARIHADVRSAATLLQRCVIQVGRRTDIMPASPESGARRKRLSPRERLIVGALVQDRSYKDVAQSFDISLSSVQAKVKSIYAKLGVHSKAELRSALGLDEEQPSQPG